MKKKSRNRNPLKHLSGLGPLLASMAVVGVANAVTNAMMDKNAEIAKAAAEFCYWEDQENKYVCGVNEGIMSRGEVSRRRDLALSILLELTGYTDSAQWVRHHSRS